MRFLDVGQAFQDRTSKLKRGIGMYNTLVQVMRDSRTSDEWINRHPGSKRVGRRWTNVTNLSMLSGTSLVGFTDAHFLFF